MEQITVFSPCYNFAHIDCINNLNKQNSGKYTKFLQIETNLKTYFVRIQGSLFSKHRRCGISKYIFEI